jgi:hypothetical protein
LENVGHHLISLRKISGDVENCNEKNPRSWVCMSVKIKSYIRVIVITGNMYVHCNVVKA